MQNASHSRHKPWDGEAAAIDTGDGARGTAKTRITQAGRRKARRKYPSILLTGTLLATAGLGAGVLIYPDRAVDVLRKQDWMVPSAAWSTVFPGQTAPNTTMARVDAPASVRTWPQEAGRPAAPGPMVNATLTNVAASHPASTASVATTKPGQRELMWLPESEKKAETPAAYAAPIAAKAAPAPLETIAATPPVAAAAPPKVAVAPAEVAPVSSASAQPAPPAPSHAEVAELLKRARAQVEVGDITGARLLLQRAASGREPSALMALAETYDPAMLARWGSRGIKGDAAKARELYQVAAESGAAEARARVLAVR